MRTYQDIPNISDGCWTLVSAEERNLQNPETFEIPSLDLRAGLRPGSAAKLLFEIETYVNGTLSDRSVDRMWVIVTSNLHGGYQGVLDSTPGSSEGLALDRGDLVYFQSEHVCAIDHPPAEFLANEFPDYFGHLTRE